MKKPLSIYLVGAFLVLYSFQTIWSSIKSQSIWTGIFAVIPLAGAVGLFLRRRWARYFVYFFSLAIISTWLISTITLISSRGWPYYTTTLESVIGLIPGFALCLAFILGCWAVRRYFRAEKPKKVLI